MADTPRKAPLTCPDCGFVQQESIFVISTCCRACGTYYDVKPAGWEKPPVAPPRAAPRVLRPVKCHRCGESHEVSPHSQSTMCPACNAAIEFGDLIFDTNVSRPVDTRGKLIIEPTGNLNTNFAVCGEAAIRGKISGTLWCEGTVRLQSVGKMSCRITAKSVVVEKGAQIEFVHLVETGNLEIHGAATGRFECSGAVHIGKGGVLEGKFHARSIVVEKGGSLLAESSVLSVLPPPTDD